MAGVPYGGEVRQLHKMLSSQEDNFAPAAVGGLALHGPGVA